MHKTISNVAMKLIFSVISIFLNIRLVLIAENQLNSDFVN